MPENEKKTNKNPSVSEEIREIVRDAMREAADEIEVALTVELPTAVEDAARTVREIPDFWDLGKPKERVYTEAHFSPDSLSSTAVEEETAAPSPGVAQSETILPRASYTFPDTPRRPQHGSTGSVRQTVDGPRYVTNSYRHKSSHAARTHTPPHRENPVATPKKSAIPVREYTPDGLLLQKVTVRAWESDVEFYGRFAVDAAISHRTPSPFDIDRAVPAVPFFSYVPQYAHMTRAQLDYYHWLRENIRRGQYPPCDLPYLQLYTFEIINLPEEIPPEEGCRLLADVWLAYRGQHPRLDGLLCGLFTDYCLIGAIPMPHRLRAILHEIVPKAQFKEFYLNTLTPDDPVALGRCVLEVSSDYDYRGSRYYVANADAYETHIPVAVGTVLQAAYRARTSLFSMDRVYRMTRDSYTGAIVSSGIKRRIDLEFTSFTRRADTREFVTALAKYAENRLRAVLGIKAKLGIPPMSAEDMTAIDRYFAPYLPQKTTAKPKEDRYMPEDYLKNYESEDSGFDIAAAQAIEAQSWVNTGRLVTEDLGLTPPGEPADDDIADEPIPGALSTDTPTEFHSVAESDTVEALDAVHDFPPMDIPIAAPTPVHPTGGTDDTALREALDAALRGEFRAFCRSRGLYEGDVADRLNTRFLDEIGDIVLENGDGGFTLIEDYREDAENWLL